MPEYRRRYIPGGTYFFTLVTERRAPLFSAELARTILRNTLHTCRNERPFETEAMVLLPDHLHVVWTLPPGDADYSTRWAWIKKEFTKAWLAAGGAEQPTTASRQRQRRRGVWQRRFWEHTIDGEDDFIAHVEYVHFNAARHGLATCPHDWPYSSFHRYVKQGIYEREWGCQQRLNAEVLKQFDAIAKSAGE